jgi:predicted nucleotidyltransferase
MNTKAVLKADNAIALTDEQAAEVCGILRSVLTPSSQAPAKAWVFGSRATGRARPYSDLDILITSSAPLDWRARADLQDAFEASNLPFRVDVVEESRLAPTLAPRVLAERQYLPF